MLSITQLLLVLPLRKEKYSGCKKPAEEDDVVGCGTEGDCPSLLSCHGQAIATQLGKTGGEIRDSAGS